MFKFNDVEYPTEAAMNDAIKVYEIDLAQQRLLRDDYKYPLALMLLKDNLDNALTLSISQRLNHWATTPNHNIDNSDGSLDINMPVGNGIYGATGLPNPSNIETCLTKLNDPNFNWTVEDNRFETLS